jgi:hypothetical protein
MDKFYSKQFKTFKMINIIIWLAALFCPNPNHTAENHGDCNLIHMTASSSSSTEGETEGDTGGETGGTHQPPPPPPPPGG